MNWVSRLTPAGQARVPESDCPRPEPMDNAEGGDVDWVGMVIGFAVLAMASIFVACHYRQEYRRAQWMRRLNQQDDCSPWN